MIILIPKTNLHHPVLPEEVQFIPDVPTNGFFEIAFGGIVFRLGPGNSRSTPGNRGVNVRVLIDRIVAPRGAEFAKDIGTAGVRVDCVQGPEVPAEIGEDVARERLVKTWQECCSIAADLGCYVTWEFEPGFAFNKPSEIVRIVEEVNRDNFGLEFDTCHAEMVAGVGACEIPAGVGISEMGVFSLGGDERGTAWIAESSFFDPGGQPGNGVTRFRARRFGESIIGVGQPALLSEAHPVHTEPFPKGASLSPNTDYWTEASQVTGGPLNFAARIHATIDPIPEDGWVPAP